jgi:hypothetical protein
MRFITKACSCLLVIAGVLATCTFTQGQLTVIASDLETDNGGYGTVGSDKWFAQGFTTPFGTTWSLSSVTLKLAHVNAISSLFDISLWSAGGPDGRPGSQIGVISAGVSSSTLSSALADHTYSSSSALTLNSGTSYFVVLQASQPWASSGLEWAVTTTEQATSPPGVPGVIGGWTRSPADPALYPGETYAWQPLDFSYPFQLAVTASPVPEPAFYAVLFGGGLIAFAAFRRRSLVAGNALA